MPKTRKDQEIFEKMFFAVVGAISSVEKREGYWFEFRKPAVEAMYQVMSENKIPFDFFEAKKRNEQRTKKGGGMLRLTFEEKTERIENALQRFRKISAAKMQGEATLEDVEKWIDREIEKARVLGFEDLLKCRLHNELNNQPKKGN